MYRALGLIVAAMFAAILGGGACGDNREPQGLAPDQLLLQLRALPGVTADEVPTQQAGFHYYVLHFRQPVDHSDPSQGTFLQEVSLLHRSTLAPVPMIVHTSGYSDYYLDRPVELTKLLTANQVSIEHRYFGESRPVPTDWTKLTIEQMAKDEHEIISALHTIYEGAFLSTGGSKGGMTAVYHRSFFPDDVVGTVPYVAPISFAAPDKRYVGFINMLGGVIDGAACRQALRDLTLEMLIHRRDALLARAAAQPSHEYTRVLIGPALEAAVISLEWTFWQYFGVEQCESIPPVTASDDVLFAFLDKISPVSDSDDEQIGFFEAYFYQAAEQLGYPDAGTDYLDQFKAYDDTAYAGEFPITEPEYKAEPMQDVDMFVEHRAERLLFIYGEWDPWTGGKFPLGDAADSAVLTQLQGTHSARIANLEAPDRDEAFAKLLAWTGVVPVVPQVRRAGGASDVPQRRMPPALVHALRARK